MTDKSRDELIAQEHADNALIEYEAGRLESAIDLMREAVILFASADSAVARPSDDRVLSRAVACRLCGDFLVEGDQYPEAANIYQQAVNQYSRLKTEEAEVWARRCAGKLLDCVAMLKTRPLERLNLLIARYEHIQRQYAAQPLRERQQAECAAHIARILARRERYEQSADRYQEALELYAGAPQEPEVNLAIAECHHRLAGLLAYRLNRKLEAIAHYRQAISLYSEHEPYVYNRQQSRDLCERAVKELDSA